jgi:hypothetical protein
MLIQDYSYYLLKIYTDGMLSLLGILSIVLIVGAFVVFSKLPKFKWTAFLIVFLLGLVSMMTAFYSTIYEFEEKPETIVFESLPSGEPTCGTGWTGWIRGAYGISNPCEYGCYRGNVLRKQMKMEGFPPWPMYKRELQCWRR